MTVEENNQKIEEISKNFYSFVFDGNRDFIISELSEMYANAESNELKVNILKFLKSIALL